MRILKPLIALVTAVLLTLPTQVANAATGGPSTSDGTASITVTLAIPDGYTTPDGFDDPDLSNLGVEISSASDYDYGVTDADGQITFTGVAAGDDYTIWVETPESTNLYGGMWTSTGAVPGWGQAELITVADDDIQDITFTFGEGAIIEGYAYYEGTSTSVAGVTASAIYDEYGSNFPAVAATGNDGKFVIGGLPDQDYTLQFDVQGDANAIAGWWVSNSSTVGDSTSATAVSVTEGQVSQTDIVAYFESGATITGTVYQSDGETPASGVTVSTGYDSATSKEVTTNAEGEYTLTGLEAGSYTLSVAATGQYQVGGYRDASGGVVEDSANAETIAVAAKSTTDDLNVTLAEGGAVTGQVRGLGDSTTYLSVSAYSSTGEWVEAQSDSETGEFEFPGLRTGEWTISVSSSSDSVYVSQTIDVTAGETTSLTFDSESVGSLSGTIDVTGTSLDSASLYVYVEGDLTSAYAYLNSEGAYTAERLPVGEYTLALSGQGMADTSLGTVTVVADAVTTVPSYTVDPASGVTFTVTDAGGEPVDEAYVGIDWYSDAGDHVPAYQYTDATGEATLYGLNAGEWSYDIAKTTDGITARASGTFIKSEGESAAVAAQFDAMSAVTLTLTDPNNATLRDTSFLVMSTEGDYEEYVTTDTEGVALLGLPAGTYEVRYAGGDYWAGYLGALAGTFTVDGTNAYSFTYSVDTAKSISGVVTLDGQPAADATVTAWIHTSESSWSASSLSTDSTGYFEFSGLADNDYYLEVRTGAMIRTCGWSSAG